MIDRRRYDHWQRAVVRGRVVPLAQGMVRAGRRRPLSSFAQALTIRTRLA
jgi:hypothetical protein